MRRLPVLLAAAAVLTVLVGLSASPGASAAGCAADAKAGFARVQLWKDADCMGGSVIVPQEAGADRPDFSRFRNYDDKVYDVEDDRSSIGVANGYCARLFAGRSATGEQSALVCGSGGPGYRTLTDLNDQASSMRVCPATNQAACARPTPTPTPTPTPAPPTATPTPTPAPPPAAVPNGAPASQEAGVSLAFTGGDSRRTVSYGRGASAVAKVTTATGIPIAGAILQVFARELRTGTRLEYRREVTTGPDGSARIALPRGPSRTVQLQYRATSDDPTPSASASVRLSVRAGVTLRLSPRRVRPGNRVRLAGSVLGDPRPPRGKVVVLQAFERGRWRTFGTARASRTTGRYSLRYRFSSRARGSFRMRAQARVDAAYPYGLGYSPVRRVRVGG